ncbi:nitrogenase component 1 [Clostridium sp. WLY-B-L2]|uniref:Nitrogenase component 1 n=1 Tax=Clostridium aromativorans TaxID=2836848 RepID=A0ABS8N4Z9_9CLOT|nr:nitrogenase component 1 [Clostridium aromativorans]MCC9294891.1 nitrogenase component 1 [Clostridium aromativorans]
MNKAYYISAEELVHRGYSDIPDELLSSTHLIYSSPATLAFNSPGAQGFGVKRAGLAIPGSVMLLISPGCCGRNTAALSQKGYEERFFYMTMDETDIVTGRHLTKIPNAVKEVCEACDTVPTAVMICITCVDALLGTDMERVCKRASEHAGVPVIPCYMYALTREGRLPPMVAVCQSIYSLLKPAPKKPDAMNIIGYFSPLRDDCELYALLRQAGIHQIREISRCRDFGEYLTMAQANFNLVLSQEARHAVLDMEKKLNIPSIELTRMYQLDKIRNQYHLFGQALGVTFDDRKYYNMASASVEKFRSDHNNVTFAVGEWANADPFELSLALIRYGFAVSEIYGTVGDVNFAYLKKIARLSPQTKIYSNLSPTMLYYDSDDSNVNAVIGKDAAYYHPGCAGVDWNEELQPFGYAGVTALFEALDTVFSKED